MSLTDRESLFNFIYKELKKRLILFCFFFENSVINILFISNHLEKYLCNAIYISVLFHPITCFRLLIRICHPIIFLSFQVQP